MWVSRTSSWSIVIMWRVLPSSFNIVLVAHPSYGTTLRMIWQRSTHNSIIFTSFKGFHQSGYTSNSSFHLSPPCFWTKFWSCDSDFSVNSNWKQKNCSSCFGSDSDPNFDSDSDCETSYYDFRYSHNCHCCCSHNCYCYHHWQLDTEGWIYCSKSEPCDYDWLTWHRTELRPPRPPPRLKLPPPRPLWPLEPRESEEYWFVYTTLVSEYECKLSLSVECHKLGWVRFTVGVKKLLQDSSLVYLQRHSSHSRIYPSTSSTVMCGRWLSIRVMVKSKSLGSLSRIESICSR